MKHEPLGFDPGDLVDYVVEHAGSKRHMFVIDPCFRIWDVLVSENSVVATNDENGWALTFSLEGE